MTESNPSPHSGPALSQALGKWSALAMMVGAVIGSGIFAKPAANAASSNSVSLIMLGWVAGGIITLVTAICMAELSLMMPKAGGTYVYIRQAYGRLPAFLAGWNQSIFFTSMANSALAVFFTMTLGTTIGVDFSTAQVILIVVSLLTLFTFVNCMGIVWGSVIQNLTTIVKVAVLVFIALLPFIALLGDGESFSLRNFEDAPVTSSRPDSALQMITLVMLNVMWAYSGGWMVTSVAEEIKEPEKNLSFALIGGAIVLMVIYIAVNLAFHGIFSLDEMVAIEDDPLRKVPQEAALTYLQPVSGSLAKFGSAFVSSVIMVSTLSALNTGLLTPPRVLFAMARDGMFIPAVRKVHPKSRAPFVAIIGVGATSVAAFLLISSLVLFAGMGTENDQPRDLSAAEDIFNQLTDFAVISATVFIVMAIGAVFILRQTEPDMPRPYRIPGYPVVPGIALIMNAIFLALVALDEVSAFLYSFGFLALSVPLFILFDKKTKAMLTFDSPEESNS